MHSLNSQTMFLSEKNKKYILSYDKKKQLCAVNKILNFCKHQNKKIFKVTGVVVSTHTYLNMWSAVKSKNIAIRFYSPAWAVIWVICDEAGPAPTAVHALIVTL